MDSSSYLGPNKWLWGHESTSLFNAPLGGVRTMSPKPAVSAGLDNPKKELHRTKDGLMLGHEGVGIVTKVGIKNASFKVGDKALISCLDSCGKCEACRNGLPSACLESGWILGHMIDRDETDWAPDNNPHSYSKQSASKANEAPLTSLSNFLLTGFECGVLNGQIKPGDTVAIVGSGRIGITALLTAQLYRPANIIMIDQDRYRLAKAMSLGATRLVRSDRVNPVTDTLTFTEGRGVDVAIETVGIAATLGICQRIVAVNGRIARMGVHGKSVELHLGLQWGEKMAIIPRSMYTAKTPLRLKTVISGRLQQVNQVLTSSF